MLSLSNYVNHAQLILVLALMGISIFGCQPAEGYQSSMVENVLQGYEGNRVMDNVEGGTISGGGQRSFQNSIVHNFGVIGGGRGNLAGNYSTISGGENNTAAGIRATIGGGGNNTASRNNAVISGGFGNTASQSFATIGGGNVNTANSSYTTISGGAGNLAAGRISTVGGGTRNQAQNAYTTIGGGSFNIATGGTSTISGGTRNKSLGIGSAIGGGAGNLAAGLESTISGGLSNQTTDNYSVVSGGRQNIAGNTFGDEEDAPYASVGGGYANQAGGAYSTVPGGFYNQALGDYSFAIGNQAEINVEHPGVFLFSDSSDSAFVSANPNEFAARATGGVRFVTAIDETGTPLTGVRLTQGSGTWETLSDRNVKSSIKPVNERQILDTLMSVPISTWHYISQSETTQHIGPMAQDFYAAFGLGKDAQYIASVDADGVAIASIQGLYKMVENQEVLIKELQEKNSQQQKQLDSLEARISILERSRTGNGFSFGSVILGLALLIFGISIGHRMHQRSAVI